MMSADIKNLDEIQVCDEKDAEAMNDLSDTMNNVDEVGSLREKKDMDDLMNSQDMKDLDDLLESIEDQYYSEIFETLMYEQVTNLTLAEYHSF